jgi:hypothetical protein
MEKLVMTIKRVLFAMIAMMLLPALAYAQPSPPPVTPAADTAVIAVVHEFTDGNMEDSVLVSVVCNAGTISPSSATLAGGEGVSFVLANIPVSGAPTVCNVTQSPLSDYDAGYVCAPGSGGASTTDPTSCANPTGFPDDLVNTATSCEFGNLLPYDGSTVVDENVGYCAVLSTPTPVDVEVTKIWEEFGAEQADFDPDVNITLRCESGAVIVGGTEGIGGRWSKTVAVSDFDDEDGNYIGEGTADFEVIPNWYPTASDPDDQEYTECTATESGIASSAVEVDNNCGDIEVAVGMGDECTITNTVFFEGIPTLSQYGMAIMVLLMLGVGFVGMRRFV